MLTLVNFKNGKLSRYSGAMGERKHRKSGRSRRWHRRLLRNPHVRNAGVIAIIAGIVAAGLWMINAGNFSRSDGGTRTGSVRHHR